MKPMNHRVPGHWLPYLEATLSPLAATLIAFAVDAVLPKGNISLIYLTAVLIVAARTSAKPALLCAGISFLAYNFFFTEPRFTLFMMQREDMLTVGFFLLMAALTGHLAARLHEQVVALRGREAINQAQFQLAETLSAAIDKHAVGEAVCDALTRVVADECFVLDVQNGETAGAPLCGQPPPSGGWEKAAARAAGDGSAASAVVNGVRYHFGPIRNHAEVTAVLGLTFKDETATLAGERQAVVNGFVHQASLALGRTQLVNELQAERLEKERELLRSALLSSISHDLRTPLAAMIGSTTSLIDLDRSLDAGQKRELLDATLEEARRLDRYIQNLLDMTRLGYDGLRLDRAWVGLDEIIHVAVKRLKPMLRGHRIHSHLEPDLPPLHVHAALIEQAIFNVLENAAKFSGDAGEIRIDARQVSGHVEVDISDQGPGIPKTERSSIFNMFFTGKQGDRKNTGTGLGLAICQGVVNAHQGAVQAFDGPGGRGLTVRIRLPVVPFDTCGDGREVEDS